MMVLGIAPIVEGHGEVAAIRTLLERTIAALSDGCIAQVLQPIRIAKSKIIRDSDELLRAVDLAALKLDSAVADRRTVLLLLDADDEPACILGPNILATINSARAHIDVACVIAVIEYETWLIAGSDTLGDCLTPDFVEAIPDDPERARAGKGWIQRFFAGTKYSETVDQVRLTARFDVSKARTRSPSFDKLCREIERRCRFAEE